MNNLSQYLNNNYYNQGQETQPMNNLCNNCGKQGHTFYQCKLPIISYGIILFKNQNQNQNQIKSPISETNDYEFLMIRRKDSFGYIDLIRGKYTPQNIEQIQEIINEMSTIEKEKILHNDFKYLWNEMWGDTNNSQYKNEEIHSAKKFEMIKKGIFVNEYDSYLYKNNTTDLNTGQMIKEQEEDKKKGRYVTLYDLVNQSNTKWKETEWEFPKGRRNQKEKDLECALREFEEETGIPKEQIYIIENVLPFEETFIGTNYKSYKHKYFLAFIKEQDDLCNQPFIHFQPSEVSKMEWKTLDKCLESIRPYHLEKKQLIQNVYKVLKEYRLFII